MSGHSKNVNIYIYIKLGTNSWYAWDGRLDLKWRRWKFWPFNKNRFKLVNCQLPHIFYFPNFSSGNILPRKMKHFNNVSSIFDSELWIWKVQPWQCCTTSKIKLIKQSWLNKLNLIQRAMKEETSSKHDENIKYFFF